ncbi:MAG: lecithin retinol acyltransferase family protein [Aphanizomenon gracile PMC627.10]|jgi:hypothetical protein|nr:lecithin retinol acyltransferase family protein [Aphanizomenon gracile PMC627.10]
MMSIFNFHPGDHIQIQEGTTGFNYYHHGIVVDDGIVIHFTTKDNLKRHMRPIDMFGDSFLKMVLQKDKIIGGFCEKTDIDKIEVVKYEQGEFVYSPEQVVKRANSIYDQYTKLINNKKYFEVIERRCDPNLEDKKGDIEILQKIYSEYPDMRFLMKPYHLKEHNCEHIARYIKTGKPYSTQEDKSGTESWKKSASIIMAVSGFGIPVVFQVPVLASIPLLGPSLVVTGLASGIVLAVLSKKNPEQDKGRRGGL